MSAIIQQFGSSCIIADIYLRMAKFLYVYTKNKCPESAFYVVQLVGSNSELK